LWGWLGVVFLLKWLTCQEPMACEKGKIGIQMTVEDPQFQDVFPIEIRGFSSLPCWFSGLYSFTG